MKRLFLGIAFIVVALLAFVSCDDDDKKNIKPTKLPIVIDYSQIEMVDNSNIIKNVKDGTFGNEVATYKQNGLEVEVKGVFNNNINGAKMLWLFPAVLTIRNIDSLNGLSKISFDWHANNTPFTAVLYDKDGNIIDEKKNETNKYQGRAVFTTGLDKASYLVIEGYENSYIPIKFE